MLLSNIPAINFVGHVNRYVVPSVNDLLYCQNVLSKQIFTPQKCSKFD